MIQLIVHQFYHLKQILALFSCRLDKIAFYVTFMAPVVFILVTNIIIFILIMYKLGTRPVSSADKDRKNALVHLRRAFGILILMGLTWSLGAFAISDARLVFQYLFALFNSLQGFSIFIFYCVTQENVRDSWVALFKGDWDKLYKNR